ncbi:MAG: DoxX family protein [Acidimicrobiales bacterium]|jgi:putative oxidoreductase
MLTTILASSTYATNPEAVGLGMLVIRVCAGVAMAAHGYQKFFSGGKITGTATWFDSMGMRPGKLNALMAASTEIGAGLLFAAGLLTSFAAMAIVALMFVAGYTVHWKNGFMSVNNGIELNFVYATLAIGVAAVGAGQYSVDDWIGIVEDLDGWAGIAIAAVGGVGAGIAQLATFYRPPKD